MFLISTNFTGKRGEQNGFRYVIDDFNYKTKKQKNRTFWGKGRQIIIKTQELSGIELLTSYQLIGDGIRWFRRRRWRWRWRRRLQLRNEIPPQPSIVLRVYGQWRIYMELFLYFLNVPFHFQKVRYILTLYYTYCNLYNVSHQFGLVVWIWKKDFTKIMVFRWLPGRAKLARFDRWRLFWFMGWVRLCMDGCPKLILTWVASWFLWIVQC